MAICIYIEDGVVSCTDSDISSVARLLNPFITKQAKDIAVHVDKPWFSRRPNGNPPRVGRNSRTYPIHPTGVGESL